MYHFILEDLLSIYSTLLQKCAVNWFALNPLFPASHFFSRRHLCCPFIIHVPGRDNGNSSDTDSWAHIVAQPVLAYSYSGPV